MKKALSALLLVAIVGGGAFAYLKLFPERRACAHYADLCGGGADAQKGCAAAFDELRKVSGAEAVERPAACVLDAGTCPAAAGCLVGGVGSGLLKGLGSEFLKGLGNAIK